MIAKLVIRALLLVAVIGVAKDIFFYPNDPGSLIVATIAGHEWEYNLWRIMGMADAFADGMPGRWLHWFSHGWGYPLFHYTSPLPYTAGGLLMLAGFDVHAALNLCWILALCGSGLIMYRACRPIFGQWGALLASVCYLFAPYHLVDVYVRTNLVETTAFLFPPIILWSLWRCKDELTRPVVFGAIAIALLPLSHILSTYLVGLGLIVFCAAYTLLLSADTRLRFLQGATLMGVIGLALSAFFWLPAVGDASAVRGFDAMVAGDYDYRRHFVYPSQLFSNYWGYGGSSPGPGDYMSFSLGIPIVICAALAGILAIIYFFKKPAPINQASPVHTADQSRFVIACLIAGVTMVFLTLNTSEWLWKIFPGIASVQFPWRFLMPASLFLAFVAGALPALLQNHATARRWLPATAAIIATLLIMNLHWDFARVGTHHNADRQRLAEETHFNTGVWTTNQLEFMPVDAIQPFREAKRTDAARFLDNAYIAQPRIVNSEITNGKARFMLEPGDAGTLILHQHWHPAWKASIDGNKTGTYPFTAHPFAPAAITVPPGAHSVEFRYGLTGIGIFALWFSIIAVAGGLAWLVYRQQYTLIKIAALPAIYFFGMIAAYGLTAGPKTQSLQNLFSAADARINAENYSDRKPPRTAWDQQGNAIFDKTGLLIKFNEISYAEFIELSLDSNDSYLAIFAKQRDLYNNTALIPKRKSTGLSSFVIAVPADAIEQGFDRVAIFPLEGDGRYSLGHIVTDVETIPPQQLRDYHKPAITAPRKLLADVSTPRNQGAMWNAPGNTVFTEPGIDIVLPGVSTASQMEISLDRNDYHLIVFSRDGTVSGTLKISPPTKPRPRGRGLFLYTLDIPAEVREAGFDTVGIRIMLGDKQYSLGHLLLKNESEN